MDRDVGTAQGDEIKARDCGRARGDEGVGDCSAGARATLDVGSTPIINGSEADVAD